MKTIIKEPDIWAAIIGGIFACGIAYFTYIKNKREEIKFAASMLLSDLMSIERYMTQEGKDTYDELADIRYSDKWQDIVGKCSFLNRNEVDVIYSLYDAIYDYNYQFSIIINQVKSKSDHKKIIRKVRCKIPAYNEVKRIQDFRNYRRLIEKLECKVI